MLTPKSPLLNHPQVLPFSFYPAAPAYTEEPSSLPFPQALSPLHSSQGKSQIS